jgi:hypothetical protein
MDNPSTNGEACVAVWNETKQQACGWRTSMAWFLTRALEEWLDGNLISNNDLAHSAVMWLAEKTVAGDYPLFAIPAILHFPLPTTEAKAHVGAPCSQSQLPQKTLALLHATHTLYTKPTLVTVLVTIHSLVELEALRQKQNIKPAISPPYIAQTEQHLSRAFTTSRRTSRHTPSRCTSHHSSFSRPLRLLRLRCIMLQLQQSLYRPSPTPALSSASQPSHLLTPQLALLSQALPAPSLPTPPQ